MLSWPLDNGPICPYGTAPGLQVDSGASLPFSSPLLSSPLLSSPLLSSPLLSSPLLSSPLLAFPHHAALLSHAALVEQRAKTPGHGLSSFTSPSVAFSVRNLAVYRLSRGCWRVEPWRRSSCVGCIRGRRHPGLAQVREQVQVLLVGSRVKDRQKLHSWVIQGHSSG